VPKLEPQLDFSVGTSLHELAKHLDFTVHRSCANLPRTPLRTFHQLLFLPRRSALPNPCSRRANLTFCTCLLAQGWQSTPMVSILNKRSCFWVLYSFARARSDFGRLWCWPALSSATAVAPCDQVCSAGIHAATCEQFGGLYAYCLTQHRAIASSKIWRTHWMTVRFISWLLYFPSQLLTVVAMRAPFSRSMRAFMCVTSICCSLIIADALPAAVDTKTPRD